MVSSNRGMETADEQPTCSICREVMEPIHTIVKPQECSHTFHAICINIWLAHNRSCPCCRREISLDSQMPWRTLFTVALVVTQEMALERAAYTYAFLSLMLRRFVSASNWNKSKDTIVAASEQFEIGSTRLPFLDLSSRTTAKKEKRIWANIYREIGNGTSPRTEERVKAARRYILQYLFFMFQEV